MLSSSALSETARPVQAAHLSEAAQKGVFDYVKQAWDSVRKAVFVIGCALVIFAAARNTITWHLQQVWGASGDYWQKNWEMIYDYFGADKNEATIALSGTLIVTTLVFWLANAFLLMLDITGRPKALLKYKIQEDRNVPVEWAKLKKCLFWVVFNQTVVGIPFMYGVYLTMSWRGCIFGRELPTFHWVLLELVVFSLVEEVFFYYSHRLAHHPLLYRHVHKMHHEWTAPIGITSIYAHPIEHMISNMLPPVMGPIIMGSHLATAWLWFALALTSTTIAHCGYHFPFLPSPEAHDFHHLKFNNCYGVLGVLDRLHGTDNQFRASKQYQRHLLLLGLIPMKQQFPEDPKNGKSQ